MRKLDDEVADLLGEPRSRPRARKGHVRDDRPEMVRLVLAWTAKGKSMLSFCKRPGTPCMRTIYNWIDDDLVFAEDFRRCKAIGCDALAQECLDIADTPMDRENPESDVRHRQLRIGTRLRLLARWDPARYGDKIQVGGEATIKISNDDTIKQVMSLLAVAKQRQLRDPDNRIHGLLN